MGLPEGKGNPARSAWLGQCQARECRQVWPEGLRVYGPCYILPSPQRQSCALLKGLCISHTGKPRQREGQVLRGGGGRIGTRLSQCGVCLLHLTARSCLPV